MFSLFRRRDDSKLIAASEAETKPPPRIALIGFAGVGKTSTINALFGTKLSVGEGLPTTMDPREELVAAPRGSLVVVDMPGLGESIERDPELRAKYQEWLPTVDVVIWVMEPRPALAPEQRYVNDLRDILKPETFNRIVFGINKIDLFPAGRWLPEVPGPNEAMKRGIALHVERVARIFKVSPSRIVAYAAGDEKKGIKPYHLDSLFLAMTDAVPPDRLLALASRAKIPDPISQLDPTIQQLLHGVI